MNNTKLQKSELKDMKNISDEEITISNGLKNIAHIISYPVLDIGSGSGKISSLAFPNNEAIHLDTLFFSNHDYQIPEQHTRIQGNFFSIDHSKINPKSLLFCHSLQYLDDHGLDNVVKKINEINPEFVTLVLNNNDGILGNIISLFKENNREENGEKTYGEFLGNQYDLIQKEEIQGKFEGNSVEDITHTLGRLILDTLMTEEQENSIKEILRTKGIDNTITINQTIYLYKNRQYEENNMNDSSGED